MRQIPKRAMRKANCKDSAERIASAAFISLKSEKNKKARSVFLLPESIPGPEHLTAEEKRLGKAYVK